MHVIYMAYNRIIFFYILNQGSIENKTAICKYIITLSFKKKHLQGSFSNISNIEKIMMVYVCVMCMHCIGIISSVCEILHMKLLNLVSLVIERNQNILRLD